MLASLHGQLPSPAWFVTALGVVFFSLPFESDLLLLIGEAPGHKSFEFETQKGAQAIKRFQKITSWILLWNS